MHGHEQEVGSDADAKAAAGDRAAAIIIRVWVSTIVLCFALNIGAIVLGKAFDPGSIVNFIIKAMMMGSLIMLCLYAVGLILIAAISFYFNWEEARNARAPDV